MRMQKISHILKKSLTMGLLLALLVHPLAYAEYTERELRRLGAYFVGNTAPISGCQAGIATGSSVFVIGDTITQKADGAIKKAFEAAGLSASGDSAPGRTITSGGTGTDSLSGLDAVDANKTSIAAAKIVVVSLGSYGDSTPGNVQKMIDTIRQTNVGVAIYWLDTITIGNPDYVSVVSATNRNIYAAGSATVRILPWYKTVFPGGDPQNPNGSEADVNGYIDPADSITPSQAGIDALADMIAKSITGQASTKTATSGCIIGDANLVGSDHEEQAFRYLISQSVQGRRITPQQAAGILGNMIHESPGVRGTRAAPLVPNPPESRQQQGVFDKFVSAGELLEAAYSDSSTGWGIVQWTPPSKMIAPSRAAGHSDEEISTLAYQLKFLLEQLNGTGTGAAIKETAAGADIMSKTTVEAAAASFAMKFERCLDCKSETSPTIKGRQKSAADIFAKYGSLTPQ